MPYLLYLPKFAVFLICASAFLYSCKSAENPKETKTTTFADYQSAEKWIKQNHKAETVTPESSLIKKMEFYPSEKNGYLIIYLHRGKVSTLLYQNISSSLWEDFKNAESKGKFFNEHIQGNKSHTLELDH
jgi:hypothetical protein